VAAVSYTVDRMVAHCHCLSLSLIRYQSIPPGNSAVVYTARCGGLGWCAEWDRLVQD